MEDRRKNKGFTLVEVIVASMLASVTLTCIVQFFLTQLHQYRMIAANNKLTENLRTFAKFFEKDVHDALEIYGFASFEEAKNGGTPTVPKQCNCILMVQERGRTQGGKGVIYFIGDKKTLFNKDCYPLYRATISFAANKKIVEDKTAVTTVFLGYLKNTTEFGSGIFYIFDKNKFSGSSVYIPGTRHSVYVKLTFIQPALQGLDSEVVANFCVYTRNGRE